MILFPALSKSIKRATVRPWCLPLGEVHLGEWVGINQTMLRNVNLIKLALRKHLDPLTTNL